MLLAKLLRIPCIVIAEYEHVTHVNRADFMLVPEVIAAAVTARHARHVLEYPGIKEDVYACTFKPDNALAKQLGMAGNAALGPHDILVTVRPPATEAHYHNPASDALFSAVIDLLASAGPTRIVLLPRNETQAQDIARRWPQLLAQGKIIIPSHAVDGLNLVWHSDLVISGGGTMNREAAALGVPVYSIFRGPLGAVDRYLAEHGRLVLIENTADVTTRIVLQKRQHDQHHQETDRSALDSIVKQIVWVAQGT
jgi:predicted glycosyltransferase